MPRLVIPLVLLLTVGGCGAVAQSPDGDSPTTSSDEPSNGDNGGPDADARLVIEQGATATGPGISVSEALDQLGNEQPLLVNGSLFVDLDGNVVLCEAAAESFPPQCAGERLLVVGLDLAGIPELEEAQDVRWAELVQLLGRVEALD